MDTPQKRLKYFINQKFAKQKDFAELIGFTPSDLNKYIGNGKSVFENHEKIVKLSNLGLNVHWYKTGEGEMLLEKNETKIDEVLSMDSISLDELSNMSPLEIKKYVEEKRKKIKIEQAKLKFAEELIEVNEA